MSLDSSHRNISRRYLPSETRYLAGSNLTSTSQPQRRRNPQSSSPNIPRDHIFAPRTTQSTSLAIYHSLPLHALSRLIKIISRHRHHITLSRYKNGTVEEVLRFGNRQGAAILENMEVPEGLPEEILQNRLPNPHRRE